MVGERFTRTITRLVGEAAEFASDADLVRRYAASGDGGAFAILVRRHGPMVFGVCRRMLGHLQDAEDAFQATFLVLARRAHAVRSGEVSRFLYGVAVRVANKARIRRARQLARQGELIGEPLPPDSAEPVDWLPLLDSAIARLPERDRWPILLCDLQGRSRSEAAATLGIAEGTLSSRLARAREKLKVKLARLGPALSLPVLAAGLAREADATVPNSLIESAIAAGVGASTISELAEGVIRTMVLVKFIKLSVLGLFVLGALTAGVVWLPSAGADPVAGNGLQKEQPAQKKPEKPNSDQERIQGTWIVDSVKATEEPKTGGGGRRGRGRISPKPWSAAKGAPINFSEDRVEFGWFTGAANFFRLDWAHEPKRIDFIARNETSPGFGGGGPTRVVNTTRPSIYKFDGDKLLIALGDDELRERPESFEWKDKRTPFVLLVLRRPDESERRKLEQAEHEYLQGTWICVMETVNGERRQIPREKRGDVKLVVKGDRLRFDTPGNDPLHATFALNLAEYPWQIDLKTTADWGKVKKGAAIAGIFSEQNGVVTLALGTAGRPTSFASAGKNGTVYVLVSNNLSFSPTLEWLEPLTEEKPAIPEPKKTTPPANKRIRELQAERIKALELVLKLQQERIKSGKEPLSALFNAASALADAELELADTREEKINATEKLLKVLRDAEDQLARLYQAGLQTESGVAQAKAARLKAEIELEKLKSAK